MSERSCASALVVPAKPSQPPVAIAQSGGMEHVLVGQALSNSLEKAAAPRQRVIHHSTDCSPFNRPFTIPDEWSLRMGGFARSGIAEIPASLPP